MLFRSGIQFKDETTLFKDPDCLKELSDELYEMYKDKGITKVAGIESRGFIMGPILAADLELDLCLSANLENYQLLL